MSDSKARDNSQKSDHDPAKKLVHSNKNKVFAVRESYFTTLLKNDHLRSVYHLFVAIFIFFILNNISHDLLTSGRVHLGLRTIKQGFARIHLAFAVWSLMHIPMVGLYYALRTWARVSRYLNDNASLRNIWNYISILSFAVFQITLLYVGTITCYTFDLPFASAVAILMETLRLIMKAHAFVRSNVPRLLMNHSKDKSAELAPISSYIYYLFAPTFLYRDSYPRTAKIRWSFALTNLLEVTVAIFLLSFIHERFILTNFKDFGLKTLTAAELAERIFEMILPSSLILVAVHYMMLHSWLNFTAEILRFGDRVYYTAWWTSANYGQYYRTWNVVVQEWFFEYVYKDSYKYIFKGSKMCSTLMVFYVSALMHEHVIGVTLQMFYPALFIFFGGAGVMFFLTTSKLPETVGKIFFWFSILTGMTVIVCTYSMEFFARRNAPYKNVTNEGWIEQLTQIPVSWTFNGITSLN